LNCAGPIARGTDESQPLRTLDATEPLHSRTMLAHAITIQISAALQSAKTLIASRREAEFGTLRSAKPSVEGPRPPRPRAGEAEHGRVVKRRCSDGGATRVR
jgi:hypothetical protein